LEELARRANVQMQSQHRSTLQYKDVGKSLCLAFWVEHQMLMTSSNRYIGVFPAATVVHDWKALLFLSGDCGLVLCCC